MKTNNVKRVKRKINLSKALILEFTGWTEDEYTQFFFEMGMYWADRHCDGDSSCLTSQNVYWGWFQMEWLNLEERFEASIRFDRPNYRPHLAVTQGAGQCHYYLKSDILKLYRSYMAKKIMDCTGNSVVTELSFNSKVLKDK